jgi:hypothetical protein
MNRFTIIDDVIRNPQRYLYDILQGQFKDVQDSDKIFKGIQPRPNDDEFASFLLSMLPEYAVSYNFIRKSPLGQIEPNYIHSDEMMGEFTALLYLSESHPDNDGTTFYDENENKMGIVYSKFNRMVLFESKIKHSRNIFNNFGQGDTSRLVQVVFLNKI